MNEYYRNLPLEEYEAILANREYWDDFSCEWEQYSTLEQRLIRMGGFVQRGGDLNRVILRYAEGREYTYRVTIQSCLMKYIEHFVSKDQWLMRIVRLEKMEAVKLLAELLKATVKDSCEYDRYNKKYYSVSLLETKGVDVEAILLAIEKEHKVTHPDETIEVVRKRAKGWIWGSMW